MRSIRPLLRLVLLGTCVACLALAVTGCNTTGGGLKIATTEVDPTEEEEKDEAELLRPGDLLKISLKGTSIQIQDHEERIPGTGSITLRDIGEVAAVGKTRVQLQKEIHEKYVPKYYKTLTVTISPLERFFYTSGDVKDPNRHPYLGKLTLTSAIAASGGLTDFADKSKILVTRTDGTVLRGHYLKALEEPTKYDIKILPGDKIHATRRLY